MKTTAWQTQHGYQMARDYKWFVAGYGDTKREAIQDVKNKVAKLEREEKQNKN